MPITHVRVHLNGDTWAVTLSGQEAPLARFNRWDDAMDYARGLAIESGAANAGAGDEMGDGLHVEFRIAGQSSSAAQI